MINKYTKDYHCADPINISYEFFSKSKVTYKTELNKMEEVKGRASQYDLRLVSYSCLFVMRPF